MFFGSITGVAVLCNEFDGQYMRVSDSIITPSIISETVNGSLINTSTVSTGYMSFDTIIGSTISTNTITINELIFSSLCMIPSTILAVDPPVTSFSSSILICLDGSYWRIPIFPV